MKLNPSLIKFVRLYLVPVFLLIWLFSLGSETGAQTQSDPEILTKVEPTLWESVKFGPADFIVHFSARADLAAAEQMDWGRRGRIVVEGLKATAAFSQASALAYLEERGIAHRSFFAGNDLYIWGGDRAALEYLAELKEVSWISAPRTFTITPVLQEKTEWEILRSPLERVSAGLAYTVVTPDVLSWAVTDTKADQFWAEFGQGEGVLVANIDTGVQWDHPALINSYKCQDDPGDPACWYDPANICGGVPCDNNGHGTATMGPMVADDDPDLPYRVGMAPGAQWIACKGCESSACSDFALMACAEWILAPAGDPDNRPHLVSNSWGGQGCDDWFMDYTNAWRFSGIAPTFSPGGSGPGCATMGSPADYQGVFAPTAHDENRMIASFAGRGPSCFDHDPFTKPNISAPGVILCVPVPTDSWNCGYSGTSFSNPYGAGGLALLMSCNPGLRWNVDVLFASLQDAADEPPAGYCGAPPDGEGNYTYGYGYVNLLAAGQANCMDLPVLQIAKETEAALPQAGDILTYTLTYSNVGVAPAYLATITDSLPVEVDYLSSYPTGTYEASTHTVSWMVDILTDSVATISLVVALDEATPISTVVTNTVDLIWEGILISDTASFTTAGAPIADFSFAIDGLRVNFTNTTQTGYPPETVFEWDFGDGVTSTVENPVHLFDTVGSYTVTLEACNAIGCSIDSGQLATCLLPEAGFITSTLGLTAYFTNTSQSASGLLWDFGDGITSTLTDPEHIYIMSGTYTVLLHAQNECGVDVVTSTLTVDALADVTVSKDGDQSIVIVGGPLTYTIMVENLGPDAATGIMVFDALPAGMIYQSASPGCSQENGIVNCAVDNLSSGGQVVLVVKLLVPGVPGEITNIAYLTSSVNDPDLTNNQAVEYTLVIEPPNTIYLPITIR